MEAIREYISLAGTESRRFVGTVTFKDDRVTLPDGSKMALGIDQRLWVLLYQPATSEKIRFYLYNAETGYIEVDGAQGSTRDIQEMMGHIEYFLDHADTEDLVTILPPVMATQTA